MNDGSATKGNRPRPSLLGFPLAVATLTLIAWQLLRILLWVRFAPAGISFFDSLHFLGSGAFADVAFALLGTSILIGVSSLLASLLSLPTLVLFPFGIRVWTPSWRILFRIAVTVGFIIGIFLLISEWYFFAEFESRFNTVAIDYLIYPHEVFTNLKESYPLPLIGASCLLGGIGLSLLVFRRWPPAWNETPRTTRFASATAWLILSVGAATLTQVTGKPLSRQRVIGELGANGWASALKASWSRNLSYPDFYPVIDRAEAFRRVRNLLAEPGVQFISPPVPDLSPPLPSSANPETDTWLDAARDSLRRRIPGDTNKPRLNLCIITEESLGSEFWGSLGRTRDGKPDTLTPRMDAVATREGLLFTHLLANGNRTIRGLEAIYSSFPPLPGDSILARDRTENVETIARVLKRDGYSTLFLYAGHGTFDYIRSYSLRNGWDRLVEESDFQNPAFRTAWGVSDEDLLQRGILEMRGLHDAGKPFFTSFMTVSNHRPFTYPKGRIPEDPDARQRDHAVKYADWSLGDFFDRARTQPFWTNTIFVVIADHGARVYGSQTIPLKSYQIPCVVVAPALFQSSRRIDVDGSQIDIAPTVLGMIGRPYESLFFGHDLLASGANERTRCLMHHNRSVAVYRRQQQVVLGLNKSVEYWSGEPASGSMSRLAAPDPSALSLRDDGIALFQAADELYTARRFSIPSPPVHP
jgi:phosphoglycerol transferase MdoB-like AlkP superfamily enzyme